MTTRWTWALEKHGYGPDGFLFANFPVDAGEQIATAFQSIAIPGYVYDASYEPQVFYSQGVAFPCTTWMDEHGYAQWKRQGYVWQYGLIRCYRHIIEIETGYMYGGDRHAELGALQEIANRTHCDLESWQIYAGGQGYDWKKWAEGTGIGSLLLQATPDSEE